MMCVEHGALRLGRFTDHQTQRNYNYRESIKRMLDNEQVRLIVNIDDLRDYNRTYADGWVFRSPRDISLTPQSAPATHFIPLGAGRCTHAAGNCHS